jgi:16S rRNA processing protein RimM
MDYIAIGTVYGSHGVQGHLKVGSFSGEFDHFRQLTSVQLRSRTESRDFAITEVRVTGRNALVKLEGIDSPEAARGFSRWELWVPRAHACPLSEGEYYTADLHGCVLQCEGATVGTVVSVWDSGASDLLEIEKPDGSRIVVPFLEKFIGTVDTAARTIELLESWVIE